MANTEHLTRLKEGVVAWNQWFSAQRPIIKPDLSEAQLSFEHLTGVNLRGALLTRAYISYAFLKGADLTSSDFTSAFLRKTWLDWAKLHNTNLTGADLTGANLTFADLTEADLTGANFTKVEIGWTRFVDVDLSMVQGLDAVVHKGPSTIGIDTLYRSRGSIPDAFLRGAGVPDEMITYSKSLVGRPFQYHSCFISYSSRDEALAQRLHADLQAKGVRCWFAPEDLKIGDEFRSRIDESIHVYDRLLLILSEHSVKSRWVQKEVETAFEKEGKEDRIVLFPVRIDEAVMQSAVGWAADIRRQRHIGDFRQWKDHDTYQKAFQRLLRDLKADI
jgi:uncharacterized protein YjbI with pentapeptide repeats